MTEPNQAYKQYGLWYYPVLPASMSVAVLSDFLTPQGDVKIGIDFLAKSDFDKDYEAHRIQNSEGFDRWRDWVIAGKIYIRK